MPFSYAPLWKTMKIKNINNKTQLRETVGITSTTLSKLSKNEFVRMSILDKICNSLKCDIADVMEHTYPPIMINNIERDEKQSKGLSIVSLFSGIGGFELGLKNSCVSGNVVFSSEIDKHAQISYKANFPNHNLHGDITKIDATNIPDHDLLIGGFPCQSFSIAGTRNGFEDIRGTLFFDIARIIKEKKTRFLLLENVKNLVSHDNSNTIRTILKTLNNLNYTIDFTIINSNEAGVPQSRERTYIVGILNYPRESFAFDHRSKKINTLKSELNKVDFNGFNFFNNLKFSNKSNYIEDILEDKVEDKYYFSKPSVSKFLKEKKVLNTNNKNQIIKLFDVPKEVINDNERQRRVYSVKGLSPTILARSDSTKVLIQSDNKIKIRKFTPIENLRAQGFSESFIDKIKNTNVSDTQLYKQSGNAVSPPIVTGILNLYKNFFEIEGKVDDKV